MSALIPYASYPPNAARAFTAAVNVGRFGYKNRKTAYKAATTIARAYRRKYSNKKMRAANKSRGYNNERDQVGCSPNSPNNKKIETQSGAPLNLDTRTLYQNDLTAIPKTTISAIDSRGRHFANVKGFAINWQIRNSSPQPLTVSIAVCSPRGAKSPVTGGFFRDYGSSRDVDFGTGLNSNEISTFPISTDKYRVLSHKRFIVGNAVHSVNNEARSNLLTGKQYIKLNRQIRFNDDTDAFGEERVYLLFWFDLISEVSGSPATPAVVDCSIRSVTYFTDEMKSY